jgi:hypothetical protein
VTHDSHGTGANRGETSAASISQRDLDLLKTALIRTEHSRRCEGFYCCTCIVGKADEALKRIEEAVRAR